MRLTIVTGMSGAGKSSVLNMLEDAGFYCVDNLPIPLISDFIKILQDGSVEHDKVAIGVDIRSGFLSEEALDDEGILQKIKDGKDKVEILFLDASDETLIKRYKETRRNHPLAKTGRIENGIEEERKIINFLKERADFIIDTSHLIIRELRQKIEEIFVEDKGFQNFVVTVLSFGYKYGIPTDADLVFDVRFLANPYYVPELKKLTGEKPEVKDFVMESRDSWEFMKKLDEMIEFLIPRYIEEGKNGLVIGVGCTGGKHRSVTIACELEKCLRKAGYFVKLVHRDISK